MSISKKLTLGYLTVSVLIAFLGYVAVSFVEKSLRDALEQNMSILARETLNKIEHNLHYRIESMVSYAQDIDLAKYLAASNAEFEALPDVQAVIDRRDAQWKALPPEQTDLFTQSILDNEMSRTLRRKAEFYEKQYGHPFYPEIYAANRYSVVVASTGKASDYRQDDEEWYQEAMRQDAVWLGEVEYDESSKTYAVDIVIKTYNKNGEFAGILKSVLSLESIIQILRTLEKDSVHFKLLTHDGKVIYSTFHKPFLLDVSSEDCFKKITGDAGFFLMKSDDLGVENEVCAYVRFKGYQSFPGKGWILTVERDERAAFKSVYLLRKILIGMILLAIIALFFVGLFLNRFISLPINRLNSTVQEIARGNLNVRSVLNSNDEIGALARAFNQMAQKLQEYMQEKIRLQVTALEAASSGILISDKHGLIQWVNPAFSKMTGYSLDEVLGKNPRFLRSGEQSRITYQELWSTILSGNTWSGELINRRKDGTVYFEKQTITPVKDSEGTITHFVAVKDDISEAKKLETQFRQAQKMEAVGRLAGGVAHDFNNILTVILGESDLLLEELADNEGACEKVLAIKNSGNRAASLTRQLLAFSRKQILQMKVVDLNEIIQGSHKMMGRLIGEDIEFVTLFGDNLKKIKVDSGQIEQVIMNLAVNARDAMPDGGKLVVKTSLVHVDERKARGYPGMVPGEYVLLEIQDSGVGLSKEVKAHLFEPFFTTKEKGKGTGLGLATVFGIIKQSKGFIYADSELGKGSLFQIFFPPATEIVPEKKPVVCDTLPVGSETILLAEDEELVRGLIVKVLSHQGFQVLEAHNGLEAMKMAEANKKARIDMLITDIVMPYMGGIELAEKFLDKHPNMKIIFTSGYSDHGAVQKWLDKGCRFLQKPYTHAELLFMVRDFLDQKT